MEIGDKYLNLRDSKVYTVAGFSITYADVVYVQNEAKDNCSIFEGEWGRLMEDDRGKEFTCDGFASSVRKYLLKDTDRFEKVVDRKHCLSKIKYYICSYSHLRLCEK